MSVLSNELFFEAHRGVASEPKNLMTRETVGVHWSANPQVAKDFAVDNSERSKKLPYVFHANIPISSVETSTDTLYRNMVGGPFEHEKEIPVKDYEPILITGRTKYRANKAVDSKTAKFNDIYSKSRTRRYNPPRVANA